MKFLIRELEEGTHHIALSGFLDPDKYDAGKYFSEEVHVVLDISRFNQNVSGDITVSTEGVFTCDRCLETFKRSVTEKSNIFFQIVRRGFHSEIEGEDDVFILHEDEKEYDLSEYVAEILSVTIPIKIVCDEKCQGLCPECGTNLNSEQCNCIQKKIDPRLEGLKKFYK